MSYTVGINSLEMNALIEFNLEAAEQCARKRQYRSAAEYQDRVEELRSFADDGRKKP